MFGLHADTLPCSQVDRLVALARMRQSGAFLSTSEGLILQLVGDASHPQFKKVTGTRPPTSHASSFSAPTSLCTIHPGAHTSGNTTGCCLQGGSQFSINQ